MLWIKAFHVIFMVTWFAGLFYLPRLFVYHSMTADPDRAAQFAEMERKLFVIMTIGAVFTTVLGTWLLFGYLSPLVNSAWMHAKLGLVAVLLAYHAYCWRLIVTFRRGKNMRSHTWYRWFNEVPALVLIGIVVLVYVRPA